MKRIFSAIIIISMVFSQQVFAASGTWLNTGVTSASWVNTNNWAAATVPGATTGTINADVATFNTAIGANTFGTNGLPIAIDPGRNIGGMSFTGAAGNYFIGATGGNALLLSSTGTTSMSGLTATNAIETINAPIVIEGAGGTYTFSNNSTSGIGVGAGTLKIGGGITGGATGATVLTLSGSNTNSNTISGIIANGTATSVAITKSGVGTWVLSGDNTYSGMTTISGGTLLVENANALGTGAVVNNATLAIGTTDLSLGAAYTQNSGSALDLTANSSSSYGNITAPALSISTGSAVNVTVGGYIANNAILNIINSGSTITGTGAPLTVNVVNADPYVSFTSSISGDKTILTTNHTTTGFASVADNSNAQAVGHVLDNEPNASSDLTSVLNTLEFSSKSQVTAALNTLGPIVDRGVMDTTTSSLNNFIGASLERAQNVLTGVSSGDESPLNGLWAKQYGGYIDQGTRDGIAGYDAWNTGTAVGLDHMFTDNLTMGASLGYAYGNIHDDENSATTYSNSAEGTLYAAYQGQNPYFIDLAGSFANNWYDGQRSIDIDNTINRTADSEYQGQQSGVYLDSGYKFDLGNSIAFTPLASLQWTHLTLGSYTETNAGDLDLMVNRQSYNILESGLGASISAQEKYNWVNVTPEFHAKWLYDFINDDMVVTSAFTGGGASFTSTGASQARDAVDIGSSLSLDFKDDISLIFSGDTEVRDNFLAIYGSVALRYKF